MNDSMGQYVAAEVVKLMLHKDLKVKESNILILGFTFKENCPDVRNTRVIDVYRNLKDYGVHVTVYDPLANPEEVLHEYGIKTLNKKPNATFDALILAVAHQEFLEMDLSELKSKDAVVYDVKGVLGEKADKKL